MHLIVRITKVSALITSSLMLSAFTFLSGPNEATLPSTPSEPEVVFYWDGSAPPISKKDEFDNGRYKDLEDEEFMSLMMNEAFDVWNNVKGSYLRMKIERDDNISTDDKDLKNSIVVKKSGSYSAAAAALPVLNDDETHIEDCDIMVGTQKVDAKDLAYILAHEIGHCVGLGHNHTNRLAIMGYTRGDYNLWLSNDDKAGIIYLYMDPSLKTSKQEFVGCGVVGVAHNGAMILLMLLLPFMGIATRHFFMSKQITSV